MKNVNYNKKNLKKLFASLGLSTVMVFTTACGDSTINELSKNDEIDSSNNLKSEQFLEEFDKEYKSNKDVVKQWDEIYPLLQKFILENGEYLDQEGLLENIGDLKIEVADKIEDGSIAITYFKDNKIKLSDNIMYKTDDDRKAILLHEAIHYLLQECNIHSNRHEYGRALDEGNAQLITNELSTFGDIGSYDKNVLYVKTISELIGVENYQRITAEHDYDELLNTLGKYCSKGSAENLIKLIDKSCSYRYGRGLEEDKQAWEIIEEIFNNKYGTSIENSDNLIIKCYSNSLNYSSYDIANSEHSYQAHVIKNYFINTEEKPRIDFIDSNSVAYKTLYLNEKGELDNNTSQLENNIKKM